MAAQSGHGTLQKETPRLCKVIVRILAASAATFWLISTRESWYGGTITDEIGTEAWVGSCGISLRQGRRAQMEDRAVCVEQSTDKGGIRAEFYAVYDGHGGISAAQHLSTHLHEAVHDALANLPWWRQVRHTDLQGVLRAALHAVSEEFLSKASRTNDQSGSTAVAALRMRHLYVVGHVGDSRALLCQRNTTVPGRTTAVTLTQDHTPAREDERARIVAAGGTVTTNGSGKRERLQGELAVSRSVGDAQYRPFGLTAEPEFAAWYEAGPADDWLILVSDGVLETFSEEEVCNIAAATASGSQHRLIQSGPLKAIPLPPVVATPLIPSNPEPPVGSTHASGDQTFCSDESGSHNDVSSAKDLCTAVPELMSVDEEISTREPLMKLPGLVARPFTLQQAVAEAITEAAYRQGSSDNLATVVVDLLGLQRYARVAAEKQSAPPSEKHSSGDAPSDKQQGLGDATNMMIPVPRRSTLPGIPLLASMKGPPEQYELKELLALVPRNPTPSTDETMACNARGSLIGNTGWQDSATGQKAISQVAAEEALCRGENGEEEMQIRWALHTGQLQLAPAAADLVQGLASLPLQLAGWEAPEQRWPLAEEQKAHLESSMGATLDYMLESQRFAQGGFGEVWRAELRRDREGAGICGDDGPYVLKHILTSKGPEAHLSGLREAYFGKLLQGKQQVQTVQGPETGQDYIVRFVEVLEDDSDLWLVFCDEGISLHSLMYTSQQPNDDRGGPKLLEPSKWWWAMRTERHGEAMLRDVLRQILSALETLHAAHVTHRDVKPENLLLQPIGGDGQLSLHVRLIDFGSAIDAHAVRTLYGTQGPSINEQTQEYAPPEALLGRYWTGEPVLKRTWPYDMWSLGVSWLELVLGTRHIFQVDARTRARLYQKLPLDAMPEEDRKLAFWLRGLMELCIYPPRPLASQHPGTKSSMPLSWSCTDQALLEALKKRDPSGQGLPSVEALRLLMSLLHWNPAARPTAEQALRHAYFMLPITQQGMGMPACSGDRSQPGWC